MKRKPFMQDEEAQAESWELVRKTLVEAQDTGVLLDIYFDLFGIPVLVAPSGERFRFTMKPKGKVLLETYLAVDGVHRIGTFSSVKQLRALLAEREIKS